MSETAKQVTVTVEFFGVPRARAGCADVTVSAATVAEALAAVAAACPQLADVVRPDGRLAPHYLLSRDGERFVSGLAEPLRDGERLLLLSADAGG
jgi:molybdopterin converting factor small subunit